MSDAKVQIALVLLKGLVDAGMEYPDAHTYAVTKSGLNDQQAEKLSAAYDAPAQPHVCRCCGEDTVTGEDCCSDDFPEPGEIREWA